MLNTRSTDEMPQMLRDLFKQAMAEKRKTRVPSPVTTTHEMPPTLRELVEQSVPDTDIPKADPFTTRHLKVILHNTKLLLDLYRSSDPDPESHPNLKPQEAKYPLEFYKKFISSTESAIIAELQSIHPELHGYRMRHQEAELKMLREKVNLGLAKKGAIKVTTDIGDEAEILGVNEDMTMFGGAKEDFTNNVGEEDCDRLDREADEIFFKHCAAPVS